MRYTMDIDSIELKIEYDMVESIYRDKLYPVVTDILHKDESIIYLVDSDVIAEIEDKLSMVDADSKWNHEESKYDARKEDGEYI